MEPAALSTRPARLPGGEVSPRALTRVLVCDDEETIRLALSRFLGLRGYEVLTATSAHDALELLTRERVEVLLCDVRMPGMTGLDLVPLAVARDADLAIIMLTAVNDAASATTALSRGAFDYLMKPVELKDLESAVARALERRRQQIERKLVDQLIRDEVALRTVELEREKAALAAMTVSIAETLINAMEAKDVYLRGHSQRVSDLAGAVATQLDLGDEMVGHLRIAGRLHDVGKIGIREEVLNKPGPLTPLEFEHVKDHVRIGMEILAPLGHLGVALRFIHDHHEHMDGSGYPRGLTGDAISFGGRILTAADAFDALTSHRAYREPMTAEQTLDYLRTQSGRLLDPRVFDALRLVIIRRG
ncbi:MAG: response regulator [Gemmatimonadaceae bacterium]|jgi:response regulator RpfG family c-di-GMP phosphodiesterase|nr:response regulator [Gemmatimonadaceae bacterium]